MEIESNDRWVLLGALVSNCEEILLSKVGYSFWVSDNNELIKKVQKESQKSGIQYFKQGIWEILLKICDGVRFDSFVDVESDFSQEFTELFPQITIQEENHCQIKRLKIFIWYNFRSNFLTNFNSKRGILTLSNNGIFYELLSHLKSNFSVELEETNKSLLDLFKNLIIHGKLFMDISLYQSNINKVSKNFCLSKCKVMNCIEHLEFTCDFIHSLSIRNIMVYLSNELLSFTNSNNNNKNPNFYENNIFQQLINNNIPIEIWWEIFDFLDDHSLSQISLLNKLFRYIWLTYHRNNLLPHQRRSVTWLLERESHIRKNHWLFQSPIKYLTSSDNIFKYLSIWHFLRITDVSQIIESNYLERIIWDSNQNYLMGIKLHPKHFNSNISQMAFQRKSDIALYMNHISKTIHLGFTPKSKLEFKDQEFSQTKGGIFCDEPGLGKTLTVLSLINKTSNQISNIYKDNSHSSYFEYPFGVITLLYKINQENSQIHFMNTNQIPHLKLVDLSIQNNPQKQNSPQLIPTSATLIIVPNHLIHHWTEEIKKWYKTDIITNTYNSHYNENHLNLPKFTSNHHHLIYLFDDPSKDEVIEHNILAKAKIVILSYRMLTKQFQLCKVKQKYKRASIHKDTNKNLNKNHFFIQEMSPILKIKWLRLIIDEGHNIGNSEISSTFYQQFIFKIKSEFKWIMSGTPLPISIIKSLNTNIPNILKFLQLPIICDKVRNYEQESLRKSTRSLVFNINNNINICNHFNNISILKSTSKTINGKISPIGLFTIFTQIGSIVVLNQKNQCLRNYLPNLIGPIKKVIKPFINNEFYIYNILCELTQRNLFCTYFNQDNIDSLLHPLNVNYRQEVIWNFRFASILGFTMNIKDFILDENKLELIKNMNLSIPYISVSTKDIQELRLMLENNHPNYENDHFYPIESFSRMEFVLNYFTNINLSSSEFNSIKDFEGNQPNSQKFSYNYYNCDSCNNVIIFPLIIPCTKLHLVCIHCIMEKHGYNPIQVDLNINNIINNNKKKLFWPKRGPIKFCIICKDTEINSDFFDRLQVPIQISYIELNNNNNIIINSPMINNNNFNNNIPLFNFPLISQLRYLLIKNYKSSEIESNIFELYQKFTDITINNINNYLYNYIHSFGNSSLPFNNIYHNIPYISIGLISLSSSKLRYILHRILKDIERSPKIKIMVVSSLWQQLDFLYYTLTILFNIGTCRYYQHIPKLELQKSIANFKKDDGNNNNNNNNFPVLLLSIDIGSHGLDLSCVSKVYILDPISDESIENQTISRAYRIRSNNFQSSSSFVKVKYCLIEDTFEDILYDYIQYKRLITFQNKQSLPNNLLKEDDLDKVKRSSKRRKRNSLTSSHGGNSHIRKKIHLDFNNDNNNGGDHIGGDLNNDNNNGGDLNGNNYLDSDLNHEKNESESSFLELDPSQLLLRIFLK